MGAIVLRRRALCRRGFSLGSVQQRAEAIWLASRYNPAVKEWLRDDSGNGHHMRLGSVGRAGVLDGALVLNGVSGQNAQVADAAALDIVGDIDIRCAAALDDWTPAANTAFVSKLNDSGLTGYEFRVKASGGGSELTMVWGDGAALLAADSSIPPPGVADGALLLVRATLDVDDGAGNRVAKFYTKTSTPTAAHADALSDAGWTQLGSTITTAGATAIAANADVLRLGQRATGTASTVSGRILAAVVKNGIGGTTVFDADFSALSDGTPWFLEATGKRVTVMPIRSAVVDGALWCPDTSAQHASSPDHPDLDLTTQLEVITKFAPDTATSAGGRGIVCRYSGVAATTAFMLYLHTTGAPRLYLSDGASITNVTADAAPAWTEMQPVWMKVTWRSSDGRVQFFTATTSGLPAGGDWTQVGTDRTLGAGISLPNIATPLTVGSPTTGSPFIGKVYRAIVKSTIDGTTVFDADFSTWDDGDGMGGYPKRDSTNKAVLVLSDTTGADTNDPKWLAYSTDTTKPSKAKGLYLPGVANNYASVPDAAALDVTGDITLDCEVALDDWTPSANQILLSKYDGAAQRSYLIQLLTTGILRINVSPTGGGGEVTANSTVAVPAVDGQRLWVRASLDVDNGAAGNTAKFFTSPTGLDGSWTQLGADVVTAGTTSIFASTTPVLVGAFSTGVTAAAGRFFRARVYNGYFDGAVQGGALVLDIDFADATEPYATFLADTGQTVTINRGSSGRKSAVVDRPMFLFGTDDYMECADHAALDMAAAQSFSIASAQVNFGGSTQTSIAKRANATDVSAGYLLRSNATPTSTFRIGDGVVEISDTTGGAGSIGTPNFIAGVRDVGTDEVTAYTDAGGAGVTDTTTASLSNSDAVRLGRLSGGGSEFAAIQLLGAAVWLEALDVDDLTALIVEFGVNV